MTNTELLTEQYLESLNTPESWANALQSHGTGTLVALFSDQSELNIANPKLATQKVPPYTGGLQTISLVDNCNIPITDLGIIQGALSKQTDQRYYSRSHLVNKPRFPKDQYFLTFSDSIPSLPPGYMAIQYEQPMDKIANPSYDERSAITIRELFVVPTQLGKKLIQQTLKSPDHIERVMQSMLPGMTSDRKRPKVKKLELIEGSDLGAIFRGSKILPTNRKVLEFTEAVGEIEPLPKLSSKAIQIMDTTLSYLPDLSEHQAENVGEVVDFRDLRTFLGDESGQYDGQSLETSQRFHHWADRKDQHEFDISFYQTTLSSADLTQPFGRIEIDIKDKKMLSDGQFRINFRRLGNNYAIELGIAKGGFSERIDHYTGDMRSLPVTIGKLPPILQNLREQVGNDNPASLFLVEGLRQVLAGMKLN